MLDRLERRFGRFAIPNVTLLLILGQAIVFMMHTVNPEGVERILLIPAKVKAGEVHRLVTFLFFPFCFSPLLVIFAWYLFYLMGTALENYWGTFRYNLFLLTGFAATVIAGFVFGSPVVPNIFVKATVFLAFAYLNPHFELRLFFILPVQIRWLAMFAWITMALEFFSAGLAQKMIIAASVLNFLLFFGADIRRRMSGGHRFMTNQAKRFGASNPTWYHKCTICGLTDRDDPQMDFRYCSKCDGDHAYCEEHLRTHDHIVGDSEE